MELESPAFTEEMRMPSRFTCDGENVSPPLAWTGIPRRSRSLALNGHGSLQLPVDEVPVYEFFDERVQVVGTPVLIVQVIGMFPHVHG